MARPSHAGWGRIGAVWRPLCLSVALLGTAATGHAALFGDDEARRAILDLRARVDANRQAAEDANRQLSQEMKELVDGGLSPARRSMLDLANQIEALRRELAEMRGQNERLARDVAELQRQQRDVAGNLNERLRPLEPVKVTLEGQEFVAKPEEKAAFEAAMTTLRASDFPAATQQYAQFLTRYPNSGYVPVVLYWQGNAQYASRSYKPAIDSYQRLLGLAPNHPRAPEAMLAIANCHLELKDARSAKAALQNVVKTYPASEAASAAKDRLSRLR